MNNTFWYIPYSKFMLLSIYWSKYSKAYRKLANILHFFRNIEDDSRDSYYWIGRWKNRLMFSDVNFYKILYVKWNDHEFKVSLREDVFQVYTKENWVKNHLIF